MEEKPIKIKNKDGKTLRGIVHIPDKEKIKNKKIGINIIVPGIKYRVAPNRMSVKIARKLCESGFYVLRTDPICVGESDGDFVENKIIKEIFIEIEKGLFVEDTLTAAEYFKEEYKLDHMIMLGNCGGALTSLYASAAIETDGLVLIDIKAVCTTMDAFQKSVQRGGAYSERMLNEYLKKVFSKKHWARLLTFKSDYKAIKGLVWMKIKEKLTKNKKDKAHLSGFDNMPTNTKSGEKFNPLVIESMKRVEKENIHVLFICAEYDASTPVTDEYIIKRFDSSDKEIKQRISNTTIQKANHIYNDIESQQMLIKAIDNWTKKLRLNLD